MSDHHNQQPHHFESNADVRILDIGCGRNKYPGALGIDYNPKSDADIVHDLNNVPYPLNSSEFDLIICNSILEHLDDVRPVLEELHRVAKPHAIVRGRVPHYSGYCAYADPTHKRAFSYRTFDFFTETAGGILADATFHIISRRLELANLYKAAGLEYIFNLFPKYYEKYLCFFAPTLDIVFELRVVKH